MLLHLITILRLDFFLPLLDLIVNLLDKGEFVKHACGWLLNALDVLHLTLDEFLLTFTHHLSPSLLQ